VGLNPDVLVVLMRMSSIITLPQEYKSYFMPPKSEVQEGENVEEKVQYDSI